MQQWEEALFLELEDSPPMISRFSSKPTTKKNTYINY
jgi:hypothetical protein